MIDITPDLEWEICVSGPPLLHAVDTHWRAAKECLWHKMIAHILLGHIILSSAPDVFLDDFLQ